MSSPYRGSAKPEEPCQRVHMDGWFSRNWVYLVVLAAVPMLASVLVRACTPSPRDVACDLRCQAGFEGHTTISGRCECRRAGAFPEEPVR
jgi:hypothetical protein